MIGHAPDAGGPRLAQPGARAALILLLSINLFNFIDRQVLAAVLTEIELTLFGSRGGHDAELGLLTTAFIISYMLLTPVFGWMADRMARWWLVGVGVILWSLASGASGMAPELAAALGMSPFAVMFITRCFVGVGEAAYAPVAPTMLSDLYPVERRGQILAWFYVAIPVGSALGYVLGGVVAGATGDWRWAFFVVVPPGILLGAWCFFMREPKPGQVDLAPGQVARKPTWSDYGVLFRTPSWVLNTIGYTALTFALGGIATWMPKYAIWRKAGDVAEVNIVFGGIVVVSGLLATLAGGWAGDYFRGKVRGAYFLVSGVAMLIGFPLLLAVLYLPFPLAWVFVFLTCFCLFFNTGPINTILANVTHPSIRATGFALNVLIIHALGDVISPPIMGLINDASGGNMNPSFLMVSFLILVGAVFWLWGTRYLDRDTELAPTRGPA